MANGEARLRVPATATKGEVIDIKSLISHPMASGFQKDSAGKTIPREIINTFTCSFNGKQVFSMKMEPAISSNPYVSFPVKVDQSGTFDFVWVDDNGQTYKESTKITVS